MVSYECASCKKKKELKSSAGGAPVCCGKPMAQLPVCSSSSTAEHARPNDLDDACDDGRAG